MIEGRGVQLEVLHLMPTRAREDNFPVRYCLSLAAQIASPNAQSAGLVEVRIHRLYDNNTVLS
jgi:hypothetical protein